jgi:septum formation inhibitor-activating ATPase MinD
MIVAMFSGSKGGVGKTTIAISMSIVTALQGVPTLLVDTSMDGSATGYLLGNNVEPPHLGDLDFADGVSIKSVLRRVPIIEGNGVELTIAVNGSQKSLKNVEAVAEAIKRLNEFPMIIVDVPALADREAVLRYYPIYKASDVIVAVAEPNTVSIRSAVMTFRDKHVVAALNCPRPYTPLFIDLYRKYMDIVNKTYGIPYVIVPYSKTIGLLGGDTIGHFGDNKLNIVKNTEPAYVQAITELVKLVLSKK